MSVPARHGEIERQRVLRAVEGLVVDLARLDPLDVRAQDRLHPALAEQRLRPDLAGGQEALLPGTPSRRRRNPPARTRCSDRSRRPGRAARGCHRACLGIPYGVPLREIYLIFSGAVPSGRCGDAGLTGRSMSVRPPARPARVPGRGVPAAVWTARRTGSGRRASRFAAAGGARGRTGSRTRSTPAGGGRGGSRRAAGAVRCAGCCSAPGRWPGRNSLADRTSSSTAWGSGWSRSLRPPQGQVAGEQVAGDHAGQVDRVFG